MAATLKEACNLKATLNHPACLSWHNTASLHVSVEPGVHSLILLTSNTKRAMHMGLMTGEDEIKYYSLLPLQEAAHLAASVIWCPLKPPLLTIRGSTYLTLISLEIKAIIYLTVVGWSCTLGIMQIWRRFSNLIAWSDLKQIFLSYAKRCCTWRATETCP